MIYFLENTNLLTWYEEQTKPCGIGHSCNCFHTFGSGIAKSIKDAYPQAYAADLTTLRASKDKLGIFSCATIQTVPHKIIYNIYGQFDFGRDKRYDFGRDKRYTSYDALFDGVSAMRSHAIENDIELLGLPQNIGCYRGGANWNIVEAILREIFAADKALSLVICHYNPSPI